MALVKPPPELGQDGERPEVVEGCVFAAMRDQSAHKLASLQRDRDNDGTYPKPETSWRMSSRESGAQLRPAIKTGQVNQVRVGKVDAAAFTTSMMARAPSVRRGSERSTRKT